MDDLGGLQPGAPVVRLDRLHKHFGQLHVLQGVSLSAREGDVVVLIGASGSGKSTLLRCANLLEIPDAGQIEIAGEQIALVETKSARAVADRAQLRRVRRRLGMVFQSFNLWPHLTVLENLIEAPVHSMKERRSEVVPRAEALLQKVGLYEKRNVYPAYLSGGQQQRAAIARALTIQPAVMLFDEPTSALDPELVGEVLRVIRALAEEGRTMIMVTHEMGFARDVASHVVFLHGGRIEEEGPPSKVYDEPDSARCRQFVAAGRH